MKRSPIKVGLVVLGYLAAGAVVNVVVAWGIAVWVPVPGFTHGSRGAEVPSSMHMIPSDWQPCVRVEEARGIGRTETCAFFGTAGTNSYKGAEFHIRHMQSGWPMRSMESWGTLDLRGQQPWTVATHYGVRIPNVVPRLGRYGPRFFFNLPLRPDMPGFPVNTSLYAATLFFLIHALRRFRAGLLLRRRKCPTCAYPIGVSAKCTECGRELPRWMIRARMPEVADAPSGTSPAEKHADGGTA